VNLFGRRKPEKEGLMTDPKPSTPASEGQPTHPLAAELTRALGAHKVLVSAGERRMYSSPS
jgi:hypothetical protein